MNSFFKEKEELENRSSFRGHIMLEQYRNRYTDAVYKVPFTEMTHYFNEEMKELGYITFEGTRFQTIHLFDPPRIWSKEILDNCQISAIIH